MARAARCSISPCVAEGWSRTTGRSPGTGALYALYGRLGENLVSMGLARAAALVATGGSGPRSGRLPSEAVPELAALVAPFAPARAGTPSGRRGARWCWPPPPRRTWSARSPRRWASTTWSPPATSVRNGRYTGHLEGSFVWGSGSSRPCGGGPPAPGSSSPTATPTRTAFYDAPLLLGVGHPHALNPDPRLHAVALARRWPIEHWDRPPGVPSIIGLEPYHLLRLVLRKSTFPYARFDIRGVKSVPRWAA